MIELMKNSKNELKTKKEKVYLLRRVVRDQKILIDRNWRTYDIPTR